MNIALSFPHRERIITGVRNLASSTIDQTLQIDSVNNYYFLEENYVTSQKANQLICIKKNALDFAAKSNDILCYANNIDLLHSYWDVFFDMQYPCRKIYTIYDLIPLIHPEWHYEIKEFFDVAIRKNATCSDKIIAISENTKKDIVYYYNVKPDKVQVIYPGVKFKDIIMEENHAEYQFEYFLSVCTIEPRKNLKGIVRAYAEFRSDNLDAEITLMLVGGMGWDQDINTIIKCAGKYAKDVIVTGYVDDTKLAFLYKNAKAFVYAPFYEGFGLPVLEALYSGRAVICSDTSSLPEVGGDAVLYCNPYDSSSIAYAMKLIYDNFELVKALEEMSLRQAEKFSFEKAAEETVKLYNTME